MTNGIADISIRKAAITAGVGLLIISLLAPFAEFFVRQSLIVPGDAATTANNIAANETLFRIAICSYLIVAILDVVIAWALYIFLRPVNRGFSLLAAWFRVVYATIFGISLYNLFSALHLASGTDYLTAFATDQMHAQVMLFLDGFSYGWDIGVVFFGLHLSVLGYLVFKSGYVPKILGLLLVITSLGYLIDTFGKFLSPNYSLAIATFTFIGEVVFMFWLLIKGARIPEMKS